MMDGWMDGWMDMMDGCQIWWMDRWIDMRDGQINRQMSDRYDGWMIDRYGGWMDTQI